MSLRKLLAELPLSHDCEDKGRDAEKGTRNMPEICRFLGIIITMYFDEHNPPHFHVRYNEYRASMEIATLNLIAGTVPARVRGLVEEWAELHREELLVMWESKDFHKLAPLV